MTFVETFRLHVITHKQEPLESLKVKSHFETCIKCKGVPISQILKDIVIILNIKQTDSQIYHEFSY